MVLARLAPGTRFRIPEAPDLGTAVLLKVNDCRALIRRDKAPELVSYDTITGKHVEFFRPTAPESVTPLLNVQIVR